MVLVQTFKIGLLRWWSHFWRRFTPAVAVRLVSEGTKDIPKTISISKRSLDEEYRYIIASLDEEFPRISFAKSIPNDQVEKASDKLERSLGFRLEKRKSSIVEAGDGIFVSSGKIESLRVVSVYPGTIYDPFDAILLQSIGNHFILRCQDGVTIDGNNRRLSAYIHRSCVFRDLSPNICDITWLKSRPFNFLNNGQYVNNGSTSHNVQYIDLDIENWPYSMRASLLPRHLRFHRLFSTKKPFPGDEVLVHDEPICSKIDPSKVPPVPHFDKNVIRHLESLSLLRFQDEYAVSTLREAVARANRLLSVDVSNVEPSYTVWEEQDCPLHDDTPEEPLSVKEVLKNATLSYEDYFVTPPGNVPLEESTQPLDISLINEWDERGVAVPPKPRKVEKR